MDGHHQHPGAVAQSLGWADVSQDDRHPGLQSEMVRWEAGNRQSVQVLLWNGKFVSVSHRVVGAEAVDGLAWEDVGDHAVDVVNQTVCRREDGPCSHDVGIGEVIAEGSADDGRQVSLHHQFRRQRDVAFGVFGQLSVAEAEEPVGEPLEFGALVSAILCEPGPHVFMQLHYQELTPQRRPAKRGVHDAGLVGVLDDGEHLTEVTPKHHHLTTERLVSRRQISQCSVQALDMIPMGHRGFVHDDQPCCPDQLGEITLSVDVKKKLWRRVAVEP